MPDFDDPEFEDAEFDRETVEQIEAEAISDEALSRPSPRFGPQAERDVPVILAADDDAELRKLLREHFESMECEFIEASDGAETLEQVIVHKPDLVVLDVMMPELNGWEVCKYIREHEELENVGVVMLTGIGPTNNELTSPLFGADDYIDKPFEFEELAFKVRKVLSERRPDGGPSLEEG
ncbi:MAG: PleD family two-component system response regulator [Bradymonadaceae bacterium]